MFVVPYICDRFFSGCPTPLIAICSLSKNGQSSPITVAWPNYLKMSKFIFLMIAILFRKIAITVFLDLSARLKYSLKFQGNVVGYQRKIAWKCHMPKYCREITTSIFLDVERIFVCILKIRLSRIQRNFSFQGMFPWILKETFLNFKKTLPWYYFRTDFFLFKENVLIFKIPTENQENKCLHIKAMFHWNLRHLSQSWSIS